MSKRSGVLVIVVVGLAYVLAVTQRSSMGASALVATERFQTNAEQLSILAVCQLIVYAGMQIPVGILLDRFGPRALLTFGSVVMSVGQFIVSVGQSLSTAIVGRILVGFGDAFIFISMIRLINVWYSGKRASQLQLWMGNLGQLGQVISAVPFTFALHAFGWTPAFLSLAAIGLLCSATVFVISKDESEREERHKRRVNFKTARTQLQVEIKRPHVRLSFWVHFCTQSTGTMLVLLWGVPYFSKAQGLPVAVVSSIMSLFVFVGVGFGFWYASVCAHRPDQRSRVVSLMAGSVVAVLLLASLWPGNIPFWLLLVFVLVIAGAGPSSMIAFDYSKEFVSAARAGSVNGFINIGGFLATFTMMFVMALVLDVVHLLSLGSNANVELYSDLGFRFAFIPVALIVAYGLWRFRVNFRMVAAQTE